MDYKNITWSKDGNFATLTINRPDAFNALNGETLKEMECALYEIENDKEIRALILTGSGEKSFIAGADIKAMVEMNAIDMQRFCDLGQKVTLKLERMDVVTVACVNGFALGGGLEMALACDFIYAKKGAKVGLPEVTLGIIPGFGGTQRLLRAVGTRLAKEMVFSGKMIETSEAKEIGLVNKVCEGEKLLEEAKTTLNKILTNGPIAIKAAKRSINNGEALSMENALELEKTMCAFCFGTNDRKEGMTAFVEKRKPNFKNN